jgi:Flp pilus assembly protein TadG
MVLFLGMAGLVVDVGHVYFAHQQLQASTDAAALAGAQQLPYSTASGQATAYSGVSGDNNAYATLPGVAMVSGYPMLLCLKTLQNEGMACDGSTTFNAIRVRESVNAATFFMRVFGVRSVPMTATATASMRGSSFTQYNVAIIVDTTASMNSTDSDSQCSQTRLNCALSGVQTLLQTLWPCAAQYANCGTVTSGSNGSGNVANPLNEVSLFTFPNVEMGTASNDYNCSGTAPAIPSSYSYPTAGASSYAPASSPASTSTYQLVGYSSDYRLSDSASSLNPASNLVGAVGGTSGCSPMIAKGGLSTYYAGVIYAAQASLLAEQASRSGFSQNVMIVISDGQANSAKAHMASPADNTGTYPSYVNECQQAITAAQAATAAGTHVYTVAYGAESSGCTVASGGTDTSSITPCQTMERMASSPQYFFSDYTATGGSSSCISASQPTTSLNQIFVEIAGDLTVPRLVPDSTQ